VISAGNRADHTVVIEAFPERTTTMQGYQQLHQEHSSREFYSVHTGRVHLNIRE
jgi:hypothetical protein